MFIKQPPWHPEQYQLRRQLLHKRARIIKIIRNFFDEREFIEVETPALQISPGIEQHLNAFSTVFEDWNEQIKQEYYLHSSPELAMKKLLVAGEDKIFQLTHCYRNSEIVANSLLSKKIS